MAIIQRVLNMYIIYLKRRRDIYKEFYIFFSEYI